MTLLEQLEVVGKLATGVSIRVDEVLLITRACLTAVRAELVVHEIEAEKTIEVLGDAIVALPQDEVDVRVIDAERGSGE